MSTASFVMLISLVVLVGVMGLLLLGSMLYAEVRRLTRAYRGVPSQVQCPRTGTTALVRIGQDGSSPFLEVLSCSRFPDQPVRCQAECFPSLSQLEPSEAIAASVT